ncbi:hypothetical protein [Bacteroides cellulosilyticus]|uniref:hypothetical protein n=1 Tax=Bacteroides cellulosilyticus TaxID=246787 RepID=UPI001F01524E|nr:hypothetical protein [Bacteroides cellulosilyticus]
MKINQIKNVVLPLLLLFCLIGCSEDKAPQTYPPTLVTNSAAELTRFEALLSGSVVPHANSVVKAEVFFLFAKGNTLVDAEEFTATPDNTTEGRYVCTIDGLTPGNEYCYSICARSGGSIAKGEVIKFETLSSTAPVPAATIATNINENGALLSSDITDNGGQNVTQRGLLTKFIRKVCRSQPRLTKPGPSAWKPKLSVSRFPTCKPKPSTSSELSPSTRREPDMERPSLSQPKS